LLQRYREDTLSFNDDIQGTGAVALAGLLAAMRKLNGALSDQRIVFFGAGSAAVGIADMICAGIAEEHNMTLDEARRLVWMVDSHGLVSTRRDGELQEHKIPYAQDEDPAPTLLDVVKRIKPTILIGCSGQPRTFTKDVVTAMYADCPEPVIFALSNPTSKSECTAEEAYTWTEGNAIFASGSPFRRVRLGGRIFIPGQGNNMFIFPGMGLGAIVSGATRITDEMFFTAAKTLAHMVTDEELAAGTLYPDLSKIRQISLGIAASVCRLAWDSGLARYDEPEDIREHVRAAMWHPDYRPYIAV
jgi:malate dehydrogenase (oxaloacetate-decarboxylating)(NADP+)